MKQIYNILSIAVLVLAGALTTGCTDQLNDPQHPQDGGKTVTLTTTVGLEGATKALTAGGVKTFAAGDQIAVIYKNTSGQTKKVLSNALTGVGTDISTDGHYATFSAALTDAAAGGAVRYIYPAAMALAAVATDAIVNSDAATVDLSKLAAQDGTLATLAENYDLAVFDGSLTGDGELPATATLSNRLAIGEFTAKVWGGTEINKKLTSLTVTDGTNTYTVTPEAPATVFPDAPIYVAMLPVADDKTVTFTATDGTNHYWKELTGQALEANNFYPADVFMFHLITITASTGDLTLVSGDAITGTGGSVTHISVADKAIVALLNVDITNLANGSEYPGITCLGDATIFLYGTNKVTGGMDSSGDGKWPGVYVPSDKMLTISGKGSLDARCNGDEYYRHAAGIGGGQNLNCGAITISGGNVTAIGGANAAGIGGCEKTTTGNITISGGTVEAHAGTGGAGIGSGGDTNGSYNSSCGNILIKGSANVTAYGGYLAAGIGGGRRASCGTITISESASATAYTHAEGGAGIGSGCQTINKTCGDICISTSGTVTATGGSDGAGIGSGGSAEAIYGKCGKITISSGIIIATGGSFSAGIGLAAGARACGEIKIESGVTSVTATKGIYNTHDCIGYGGSSTDLSGITLGTITIDGVTNPTPASMFEHFNSTLSADGKTWMLTHK